MCYITFSLAEGTPPEQESRLRALLESLSGVLDWGHQYPGATRPFYANRYFVRAEDAQAEALASGLSRLPFVHDVSAPAGRELIAPVDRELDREEEDGPAVVLR